MPCAENGPAVAGNGIDEITGKTRELSVHEKLYAVRTAMAAVIAEPNTLQTFGLMPNQLGVLGIALAVRCTRDWRVGDSGQPVIRERS